MNNAEIENNKKEFEVLIKKAISVAEGEVGRYGNNNPELLHFAQLTVEILKNILIGVMSNRMLPSEGAILGLTRNIGEWSDNRQLKDLACELDKFYSEKL